MIPSQVTPVVIVKPLGPEPTPPVPRNRKRPRSTPSGDTPLGYLHPGNVTIMLSRPGNHEDSVKIDAWRPGAPDTQMSRSAAACGRPGRQAAGSVPASRLGSRVLMTPRGDELIAQSSVLGDVELPTCQPQIQVVGVINFTFVTVKAVGHPGGCEKRAHGPQHQPEEAHPKEAHQEPSAHTPLPAPSASEHQGHPFRVLPVRRCPDSTGTMTIGQAEP